MARYLWLPCHAAAATLIAVSAAMNFAFAAQFGRDATDALLLGLASIGFDAVKVILPVLSILAWRRGSIGWAAGAALLFLLLALVSFLSALGFAAEGREWTRRSREVSLQAELALQQDLASLNAAITRTHAGRPADLVLAEIAREAQLAGHAADQECTPTLARRKPDACEALSRLRLELAQISARERLIERRDELIARLGVAAGAPQGLRGEPQLALLSGITGLAEPTLRTLLIVLLALAVELGSGLGIAIGEELRRLARQAPALPAAGEVAAPPRGIELRRPGSRGVTAIAPAPRAGSADPRP